MCSGTPSDRGQSELIGTVLLLGIVILGSTAAVVVGTGALEIAQTNSRSDSVGHAMTQFDSQAAMVALGNARSQSMDLGTSGDGSYTVHAEEGWVNVSHVNHSGSGDVETLTNTSLGAVIYEDGDVTIDGEAVVLVDELPEA